MYLYTTHTSGGTPVTHFGVEFRIILFWSCLDGWHGNPLILAFTTCSVPNLISIKF